MTTKREVTEPAAKSPDPVATEPATAKAPNTAEPVQRDPRKLIDAYNVQSGIQVARPVPETHLDIFPDLRAGTPTRKED